MLSLATSFAIVLGFAQATVASPDVEAVLRHSAARGRPLAGLHQAVQRQSQSLNALAQRSVLRLSSGPKLIGLAMVRNNRS